MPHSTLNPRESRVSELVSEGNTNAEIAAELGISVATVKRYLANVMIKWNCKNRTEVAVQAIRRREQAGTVVSVQGGAVCPTCGQTVPRATGTADGAPAAVGTR